MVGAGILILAGANMPDDLAGTHRVLDDERVGGSVVRWHCRCLLGVGVLVVRLLSGCACRFLLRGPGTEERLSAGLGDIGGEAAERR